jgi:hypothetical protein
MQSAPTRCALARRNSIVFSAFRIMFSAKYAAGAACPGAFVSAITLLLDLLGGPILISADCPCLTSLLEMRRPTSEQKGSRADTAESTPGNHCYGFLSPAILAQRWVVDPTRVANAKNYVTARRAAVLPHMPPA